MISFKIWCQWTFFFSDFIWFSFWFIFYLCLKIKVTFFLLSIYLIMLIHCKYCNEIELMSWSIMSTYVSKLQHGVIFLKVKPGSCYTVDGLNFVGYQFSWFLWRVQTTNSSTHEMVIFCMNYERKYYGHEIWTPRMSHFCSIHENWYPRK